MLDVKMWSKGWIHGSINKTKKFNSDVSKLVKSLRNYLHKGYNLTTIIDYLKQVLIANK